MLGFIALFIDVLVRVLKSLVLGCCTYVFLGSLGFSSFSQVVFYFLMGYLVFFLV